MGGLHASLDGRARLRLLRLQVFALGVVSVFEQILESLPEGERVQVFKAYIGALDESPDKFKADAARLEETAGALSGPEQLAPDAGGSDVQVRAARTRGAANAAMCTLPCSSAPPCALVQRMHRPRHAVLRRKRWRG